MEIILDPRGMPTFLFEVPSHKNISIKINILCQIQAQNHNVLTIKKIVLKTRVEECNIKTMTK